jgi:hypothetical protein
MLERTVVSRFGRSVSTVFFGSLRKTTQYNKRVTMEWGPGSLQIESDFLSLMSCHWNAFYSFSWLLNKPLMASMPMHPVTPGHIS